MAHKRALRVLVARLFNGVVHARGVDAGGARLHLHLAPVNAGLVVHQLARQPKPYLAPVQPQRVGRHRDQHGTHAKVEPSGVLQHGHAGVDQGPTGAALGECLKVAGLPVVFAQAVVAGVHVVPLDVGFAFELLNKVAVPMQPAEYAAQAGAARVCGMARGHGAGGGLHHLAHA